MSVKQFHVAYITDDNYAMPTCVSIISLLENKMPDVSYVIHLIMDNVSEQNKNYFKEINYPNCEIDIIDADSSCYQKVKDNLTNLHVTKTALLKFNLPEFLHNVDTLLYIDGDTVIIHDISELFDIDISQYYAAVVENTEALKFSTLKKYFNNGIMLLNLKKMRANDIIKKLIEYRKNNINYYMDQDAFNIVFNEEVLFISMKYNFRMPTFLYTEFSVFNKEHCSNSYTDEYDCLMNQKILHAVQLKPWQYNLPWFTDIFIKYRKMSPYKNEPLSLKTPFPIVIKTIKNNLNGIYSFKDYRFPREKISKGSTIILYGAGEVGQSFWYWIKDIGYCKVLLWVDIKFDEINNNGTLEKVYINSPDDIKNFEQFDYVLIAIVRKGIALSVSKTLMDAGIPEEKIVTMF